MSFTGILSAFFVLTMGASSASHAVASHTAKADVDLIEVDEKGKEKVLEGIRADFSVDWTAKKCELRLKKDQFAYCALDTSTDLLNSKNELVMKAIPKAHFESAVMDALIRQMASGEKALSKIIPKIISDTDAERASGFDLPFYTCGDCEKNGKALLLWNAYDSYVIREVTIRHAYLGQKKLILRLKLRNMKAHAGAFNVIDNGNAEQYGR